MSRADTCHRRVAGSQHTTTRHAARALRRRRRVRRDGRRRHQRRHRAMAHVGRAGRRGWRGKRSLVLTSADAPGTRRPAFATCRIGGAMPTRCAGKRNTRRSHSAAGEARVALTVRARDARVALTAQRQRARLRRCRRTCGSLRRRCAQIAHQAVLQSVDPAVHGELLSALPRVLHDGGLADVGHLLDHVELAQAVDALRQVRHRVDPVRRASNARPARGAASCRRGPRAGSASAAATPLQP